jgi:hypothetical protein
MVFFFAYKVCFCKKNFFVVAGFDLESNKLVFFYKVEGIFEFEVDLED